ncbi:MAG TPA: hypothetical protein VD902_10365, partial [Symbiobacteriaceae bacterium]|nr:hypothetical protein [Symbiobacteriaceae bacterium]
SIIMKLLQTFGRQKGHLALLVKNAVIRNLIRDLPRRPFPIADIKAYGIDARKHFGASVDASLLFLRLGADVPSAQCTVFESMASDHPLSTFGWCGEKFVADVEGYERLHHLDGQSPYVWRQGLKHDCARVMELTGADGRYTNSLGETVELEPESVYPLLKSSDLKGAAAGSARFVVPVPQHKIGEDTAWVAQQFPRLWAYLERHQSLFRARKSAIYKGQPRYAMFGIGEYSFAPYKVAVSGLYKRGTFTLIGPQNGRPVMLDDTCYFLGFDGYEEALRVCTVLNSEPVQRFLQSVVFLDAKRPYTKELLMRIDLSRAEATR